MYISLEHLQKLKVIADPTKDGVMKKSLELSLKNKDFSV